MQSLTKRLDTPLKWIGAVGAVVSLALGVHQVTRLVSEVGERQRQVAELHAVATQQMESADYPAAWTTLDEAMTVAGQGSYLAKATGRLDRATLELRTAQEDLAMAWLRDVSVPSGSTFSAVVDPLLAVITRGVVGSTGPRRADLLGHAGWAHFLKSRDGAGSADPAESYRQAIEIDSANPFAHAHWGHWIMWRRGAVADASPHFEAAVASGRERTYVRRLQIAAMRLFGSPDSERGLFEAVNEMRQNGEPIDVPTRRAVFSIYYSAFNSEGYLQRVLGDLPPLDHIATIRALFFEADFDRARIPLRDAMVALLQEAAGLDDEALATWRAVQAALPPDGDQRVVLRADAAIERLSQAGS